MNNFLSGALIAVCLILSGCTALSAVSMIGNTISRTVEAQQRKKAEEPAHKRVAITNVNLGVEYMRQGYYEKALDKFNRALEADPDYALTYNMLGVLYQLLEDPDGAEKHFKHSLKIDKEKPSTLNNYGQFLCKQDRELEAEEKFLTATNNPFYTTPELAYANVGSCAYMHKKTEIAVKYFEKSLFLNPDMSVALSQMAEISFDRGDYIIARDYMDRYLKQTRHTPRTLWLAIRIERQFNDVDKLASYSLLLRNQFPDTVEAELLRISEEYLSSTKTQSPDVNQSRELPDNSIKKLAHTIDAADLLVNEAEKSGDSYETSVEPQKSEATVSRKNSEQSDLEQLRKVSKTPVSLNTFGLISEADYSFYPLLLQEKDLLDIE
jgi:type IV pilus assembly protein PilF